MSNRETWWDGGWCEIRELGKGGQGVVLLARKVDFAKLCGSIGKVAELLRPYSGPGAGSSLERDIAKHVLARFQDLAEAPLGALKVLLPRDTDAEAQKAHDRWKRETEALRTIQHPNLIKLLDSNQNHNRDGKCWFVMEYHRNGSLDKHRGRFTGNVRATLEAILPLVDAVAKLHKGKYIHRDIKPQNIFVADDGQLVLGDFGLVYPVNSDSSRVTGTNESVGSGDWMPPWADRERWESPRPVFDVFTLAKVIWWMISGRRPFPHHYYDRGDDDLAGQFPNNSAMAAVNTFLGECIVDRPESCDHQNARALWNRIAELQREISKETEGSSSQTA